MISCPITLSSTIPTRKLNPLISSSILIIVSSTRITHATLTLAFTPTLQSSLSASPLDFASSVSVNRWCQYYSSHRHQHRRSNRLSYPRIMSSSYQSKDHDDNNYSNFIMESPSAERNKGPIYDLVLSPIIFPQLLIEQEQQQQINANNSKNDPPKIRVLELAAGCGVHTTHFVSSFLSSTGENQLQSDVDIEWHPSDPDLDARKSIDARVTQSNLKKYVLPSNSWILGTSGGTACNDGGHRDTDGNAGANQGGNRGNVQEYASHHEYFDLILCINMIHIAPWEATLGLMECSGKVLRKGGLLMCYGPYKVNGKAVESNLNFDASLRSKDPQWGIRNLEDVIDVAKREGLEYVQTVDMPANNLSVIFRKK